MQQTSALGLFTGGYANNVCVCTHIASYQGGIMRLCDTLQNLRRVRSSDEQDAAYGPR